MGYTAHHAIIVTSYSKERMDIAYQKAVEIFPLVSPVLETQVNAWLSFFIPTDGSKEWWPESDAGDNRRAQFVEWLNTQRFEDGSSPYRWVELRYGDDDYEPPVVVRHSSESMEAGNLK